ncbi:MAG: FUN14 domain-containing protein [Candidatus Nitrosopolaris sp.]
MLGAVAGYAIKKEMKVAAVVIGLFVAAYLSYKGWVDLKWAGMENASRSTLTNASEQVVHALNNTATQFASHPSAVAASGLPIAAPFGFIPRLMMGFKKG